MSGKMFYSMDEKLDFSDVLILPANSNVSSRAAVNLDMDYSFKFGGKWHGIGIIASNMDSTGTFPTATALSSFGLMTAVHKHYKLSEWEGFLTSLEESTLEKVLGNITVSCGIGEADIHKAHKILDLIEEHGAKCKTNIGKRLMVDVANGHDQSGGEMFEENGKKFKLFYGMSSAEAQHKWSGGVQDYRSSEGKSVKMPYRGDICSTIREMLGGIRSSCTYVGASNVEMLKERGKFIKVRRTLNDIYRPYEN